MAVYIETGFTGDSYPLKNGRVGWNWHNAGTISATTEADGFDAVNAMPPRPDSAWRPTAIPATWTQAFTTAREVSFIGIANHDLGTQNATISVEYDVGGTWTAYSGLGSIQPDDDSAIFILVDPDTVDGVRVVISAADDEPTLSVIMVGVIDEWPLPFVWTGAPITEGDQIQFENNLSMSGNFVGRTATPMGQAFELTMNYAPESWRSGDFADFKAYANGGDATFFIAARPDGYADEVAYAWCPDVVTAQRSMANQRVSTSVTLKCLGLRNYV